MKRILKEPLFHFLLLGAAIFLCYNLLLTRNRSAPDQIVITMGQVEHLAAGFAKTWQRPPTPEELAGLVRDRVREEVYYREAMALGLDQDDTIIRRRLRQKMEFISDDIAAQSEPSDEELNAYLSTHRDAFRIEPRFSFSQVYLNPDRRGANLERDTQQLLEQLNQGSDEIDPATLGDSTLLAYRFTNESASEVASQFGKEFAAGLSELTPGRWQGPVRSGYGVHLVLLMERTEARLPELAEIRDLVRRDWQNAQRLEANEKFYQELLKRYTVIIEGLGPDEQQGEMAANQPK